MTVITGTMALVLFVGSARKDATPEQIARLKAEALPPLRDTNLSNADAYRTCLYKTVEIMGPEWEPAPEFQTMIDRLVKPND